MTDDLQAELNRIRALARQRLSDYEVDAADHAHAVETDDGVVLEKNVRTQQNVTETVEHDLEAMFHPEISTTGSVEHLRIEAQLHADGEGGGNPHIPADTDTLAAAREAIVADGNEPAWEAV